METTEELCQCSFTRQHITKDAFTCLSEDGITYRARLHSTDQASSLEIASYIEQWTSEPKQFPVQGLFLSIDSTCTVAIDSLTEKECLKRNPPTPKSYGGVISGVSASSGVVVLAVVTCCIIGCCLNRKRKTDKLRLTDIRDLGKCDHSK